jgi:predicted DNA-binding transcriptional regulator AlpA
VGPVKITAFYFGPDPHNRKFSLGVWSIERRVTRAADRACPRGGASVEGVRMPTDTTSPRRHNIDKRAHAVAEAGAAAGNPDDLLTTTELCEWTGLSHQFYEIGRCRGYGPRYVRLSTRRVRYLRADVLRWLAERTYQKTTEYTRRASTNAAD